VLKIVKNKRYVNVVLHTLTFGGRILPFLPFAFFQVFERGVYIIKGGLLKYIFKYLFIFTYIIIKGIFSGKRPEKGKRQKRQILKRG
jgi:hypothetical protein